MDSQAISVSYRSRGALLVCGTSDRVRAVLPQLSGAFKTLAVADAGLPEVSDSAALRAIPGTLLKISGHLGCFRAAVAGPDGALDLGPLSSNGDGLFDLVLDLYDQPLIDLEVSPLGYVRTRGRLDRIEAKVAQLERWVGTVHKPRYFTFDEDLCAFDRQGVQGCRRCLDACPAGAISVETRPGQGQSRNTQTGASALRGIRIDPYLCRGCGTCTITCPTGAVRYGRPKPAMTLQTLAERIATHDGETAPTVLIHSARAEDLDVPQGVADLAVTAIGSIGPEIWLGALALGASRVIILCSAPIPPTTLSLLEAQVDLTRHQLDALGVAPERLRLVRHLTGIDWQGLVNPWPPMAIAVWAKATGKREQINTAFRHLAAATTSAGAGITLEANAPFGDLALRETRCTLCMACVGLCPTGALKNREGALAFAQQDCVQCGLCMRACPEKAIDLVPCFSGDPQTLVGEHTLKAASEWFHCVSCATPFAPRSLVEGSIAHVNHHPMFQGDGRRLLEMCPVCRRKASAGVA